MWLSISKTLNLNKKSMGDDDPFNFSSYASMTCSGNFRSNHIYVHIYLPSIIADLSLVQSSTCEFCVAIFVTLNSGRVNLF